MEIEEGDIRRGRRPRWITPSEISIILHMIRKPNSKGGIERRSSILCMTGACSKWLMKVLLLQIFLTGIPAVYSKESEL